MAQVDSLTRASTKTPQPVVSGWWMFEGLFSQDWGAKAAAFASVCVVMLGFLVGQVFYGTENVPVMTSIPPLVAFADETAGQYVSLTDPTWGESGDNAE